MEFCSGNGRQASSKTSVTSSSPTSFPNSAVSTTVSSGNNSPASVGVSVEKKSNDINGINAPKNASLKGVFKTFPLQDLLMLVAQQRRTGILHLTNGEDDAIDMTFREGKVIRAKKAKPRAWELFGNLLVEANLITDTQRMLAVDEQRRTLKQLGEILVDMGALSRDALRDFVYLQTMEAIYQPFEWGNDSVWEFTESTLSDEFEGVLPLDCAPIVQEGLRRRRMWPTLRRRFKSPLMTFRRAKPFPPPGSPALLKAQKKGNILGVRERRIYALAEPGVSMANIVSLSKLGEFEVMCALDDLYDAGLIRFSHLQGMEPVGNGQGGFFSNLRGKGRAIAFAFMTVALGVLSVWKMTGGTIDASLMRTSIEGRDGALTVQEIISGAQTIRLSLAIETYRIETGKIPDSLDELVAKGRLTLRDTSYPFKTRYIYRPQKDGSYLLLPPLL